MLTSLTRWKNNIEKEKKRLRNHLNLNTIEVELSFNFEVLLSSGDHQYLNLRSVLSDHDASPNLAINRYWNRLDSHLPLVLEMHLPHYPGGISLLGTPNEPSLDSCL